LLLVRPDGYLARQAPLSQPGALEAYLEQLTAAAHEFERENSADRAQHHGPPLEEIVT